jgi:hypothetical protein
METLDVMHIICLVFIALGFAAGLIPIIGTLAIIGILPLILVSIIFSIVQKNGTLLFSLLISIFAIITLVPLLGSFSAIVGFILCTAAVFAIIAKRRIYSSSYRIRRRH